VELANTLLIIGFVPEFGHSAHELVLKLRIPVGWIVFESEVLMSVEAGNVGEAVLGEIVVHQAGLGVRR